MNLDRLQTQYNVAKLEETDQNLKVRGTASGLLNTQMTGSGGSSTLKLIRVHGIKEKGVERQFLTLILDDDDDNNN